MQGSNGPHFLGLLPALPMEWPTGKMTDSRVWGGAEVEMTWENRRLKNAEMSSENGGTFVARYSDRVTTVVLPAHGQVMLDSEIHINK